MSIETDDKMDFRTALETKDGDLTEKRQMSTPTSSRTDSPSMDRDSPSVTPPTSSTQLPRQLATSVTMTTLPDNHSSFYPLKSSSFSSIQLALSGTRSLPIHCIIEQTSGSPTFDTHSASGERSTPHTTVELDSYAILPGTTPVNDCVQSALTKLGYSTTEAIGARGAIQIKNWKPLSFDSITDNTAANIDDLLGELTQVATLRIRICSTTKVTSAEEVKERLLQLLLNQSQGLLGAASYPDMEKNGVTNGHQTLATISPEMRRAFDKWYEEQLKAYMDSVPGSGSVNMTSAAKDLLAMQQQKISLAMAMSQEAAVAMAASHDDKVKSMTSGRGQGAHGSQSTQISPPVARPNSSSTPTEAFSHPAYQHYLPGKTRMRTSFDPECEIPRLQRWFADNQHPSREQMLLYLNELNSLESRKGRRPLDLTNIIYWFKNARAAHRRASKNNSDDSFEMEDEKDVPQVAAEGIPFLPNRNAVYMVPYPHFPNVPSLNGLNNPHMNLLSAHGGKHNGQYHDREPCDLSLNGQMSRSPQEDSCSVKLSVSSPSRYHSPELSRQSPTEHRKIETGSVKSVKSEQDELVHSPAKSDEGYSEMVEKPLSKSSSPEKDRDNAVKRELSELDERPTDLTVEKSDDIRSSPSASVVDQTPDQPHDLSVNKSSKCKLGSENLDVDRPTDLSNGKRRYESDDDLQSDYDDEDDEGSISSHDEGKLAALRESYLNSTRSMNFGGPVTSGSSGQPLHIPQFPHPLAMHYFPLNTHFYSQQANQLKYPGHQQSSQQSTPKSSPGSGQENNSSLRKRRTRVFIDPLSEIPKLEKWFLDDTHPSSYMIDKYCEELNSSEYRQKFPKLEPKNVQLWFKNHRAKVKRMRIGGLGEHVFV